MHTIQMVSTAHCSLKAMSLKMALTVGIVNGTYILRTGEGSGVPGSQGAAPASSSQVKSSPWPLLKDSHGSETRSRPSEQHKGMREPTLPLPYLSAVLGPQPGELHPGLFLSPRANRSLQLPLSAPKTVREGSAAVKNKEASSTNLLGLSQSHGRVPSPVDSPAVFATLFWRYVWPWSVF